MTGRDEPRPERTAPPTAPGPVETPRADLSLDSYNRVAETVGMVPSLRMKDNVVQALVVLATAVIGAGVGWLVSRDVVGLMFGAIGGLVVGLLASGIVLMVLGWVRAARSKR